MPNQAMRRFARTEDGAMTVFNLFMFVMLASLLGLSLDVANAYKVRTELQIAADTASHAALYNRAAYTAAEATNKALEIASFNLAGNPESGQAVKVTDVQFGTWDDEARVFTPNAASK